MGKQQGNSYRKLKRSPEERLTQTHGNLFEIFSVGVFPFLSHILCYPHFGTCV